MIERPKSLVLNIRQTENKDIINHYWSLSSLISQIFKGHSCEYGVHYTNGRSTLDRN